MAASGNQIPFEFTKEDENNILKLINKLSFEYNNEEIKSLKKCKYLAKKFQEFRSKYEVELEEKKTEIGELSERIEQMTDLNKELNKELAGVKKKLEKFETENVSKPQTSQNPIPNASHLYNIANCNINHAAPNNNTDSNYKTKYEEALKEIEYKEKQINELQITIKRLEEENSNYSNEIKILKLEIDEFELSQTFTESGL